MKICTINLPKKYLKAIKKICKVQKRLSDSNQEIHPNIDFPSRSEFVRVAVREALLKFLEFYEKLEEFNNEPFEMTINKLNQYNGSQNERVLVPERIEGNKVKEFKTHKIVRRLEF